MCNYDDSVKQMSDDRTLEYTLTCLTCCPEMTVRGTLNQAGRAKPELEYFPSGHLKTWHVY